MVVVTGLFPIKTTHTPHKNGSYGINWGIRMPYFGSLYAIFSVEIPLFEPTSMPYRPLLYGIVLEHIFCKYGGWGWSELFSYLWLSLSLSLSIYFSLPSKRTHAHPTNPLHFTHTHTHVRWSLNCTIVIELSLARVVNGAHCWPLRKCIKI